MPDLEEAPEHRPAAPALVLVDSSFALVSYNAEAIRILTYPQNPEEIDALAKLIESRLGPLLTPLRSSHRTPLTAFRSGRRQYAVRIFTLNNHRKAAPSIYVPYVAHALLLERQDRKIVDLPIVAEQFHLTPREGETLRFLLEGMTSKEIANRMGISPHTVKAFLRLVMSKMQVSTRSGIIGKIVLISK
jgi:DNA-binding CsgD family transcriptional regulator